MNIKAEDFCFSACTFGLNIKIKLCLDSSPSISFRSLPFSFCPQITTSSLLLLVILTYSAESKKGLLCCCLVSFMIIRKTGFLGGLFFQLDYTSQSNLA
jgi:hypothetical protein